MKYPFITKEFLEVNWLKSGKSLKQLSIKYEVPLSILESRAAIFKVTKGNKLHYVNESKFNLKDPVFCYYVGLLITDGHIDYVKNKVSLRFNSLDGKNVLESLLNYFEFTGKVANYKNSHDLTICSIKLVDYLKEIGFVENKTYDAANIIIPDINKAHYYRGILDGDGNVKLTGIVRIVTASTKLIADIISDLNHSIGTSCTLSWHKGKSRNYPKIEMRKQDSLLFLEYIYKDHLNYFFTEKYNRYLSARKRYSPKK